jgi:hypothetical protein
LESGQPYAIKGIGVLQKDESGKLFFEGENKISQRDKLPETDSEPVPPVDSELKPTASAKPKRTGKSPVPVVTAKDRLTEEEIQTKAEEPTPLEIILDEEHPHDAFTEDLSDQVDHKQDEPVIKTPEPLHLSQLPDEKVEEKQSFVIQANQIVKWIIFIVLANAVIIVWFMAGDHIRELFKGKKHPAVISDSVVQDLADSVKVAATDTTLIFGEETIITKEEESAAADEILRYYIVVGSFRNEANADALVDALKSKGYNAEKFVMIGNKYIVSGASFDDKELALKELKSIREEFAPDAWMTRF